jgi:hypothetical protein
MNDYEFKAGIERIEKATEKKLGNGILSILREKYLNVDASLWMKICEWVVDHANFSPKVAKFKEAYSKVIDTYKQERGFDSSKGCFSCKAGFQDIYYISNGMPYQGVTPCKECNRSQYLPSSKSKIERYITKDEFEKLQELGRLGQSTIEIEGLKKIELPFDTDHPEYDHDEAKKIPF